MQWYIITWVSFPVLAKIKILLVETLLEFWWLEIINRTLKTTITWKSCGILNKLTIVKDFTADVSSGGWFALTKSLRQKLQLSHESALYGNQFSLSTPLIISSFLYNNCFTEVATAHYDFFRNCSLCHLWLEARVEMALSRTKSHWVVVVPVNSDGIMTSLIQLHRACGYCWVAGILNNMNPLISAPPKRMRSRIILQVAQKWKRFPGDLCQTV